MESLPLPPLIPPLVRFSGAEAEDFWQQQMPASLPPQMSPPPPFVGEEDAVHINATWSEASSALPTLPHLRPAATDATYEEISEHFSVPDAVPDGSTTTARASTSNPSIPMRHTNRMLRKGIIKTARGSYIKSQDEASRVLDDALAEPTLVSKKRVTKALSVLGLADLRAYVKQPSATSPSPSDHLNPSPSDHLSVNQGRLPRPAQTTR
jgi:hypothetical protein